MSQHQTIQDTNHGTLETSLKKRGRPKKTDLPPTSTIEKSEIQPIKETKSADNPDSFERKIGQAQMDQQKWVETDVKMFDYLVRHLKEKPDHILYRNIFVTTYGKIDEIEKRLGLTTNEVNKFVGTDVVRNNE